MSYMLHRLSRHTMDLQLRALNMSNSTKQVKVMVTSRSVTTWSCV